MAFDDQCILFLDLKGPKSLMAEYEDIKGNIWTTTINENSNSIDKIPKNERQLKVASKYQWQLNLTEVPGTRCIGFSKKKNDITKDRSTS
ncbi:MAG: hypothetical protein ACYC2E_11980 [Sulfuricella sp.]